MNTLVILPLLAPLFTGVLLLALAHTDLRLARAISILGVLLQLLSAVLLLTQVSDGSVWVYRIGDWPAPFGIVLVADRLAGLMLLLTGVLALPALVHACAGWDRHTPGFHTLFQFQLLGLDGAFLTGDLFNLFVCFEILLIASFGLLLHGGGAARVRAGFHYVVLNLVGSALFLLAVGLLYGVTGTLNMADLAQRVAQTSAANTALIQVVALLLLVVFGLKAALVPLHFWLAPAYAAAAAPVAALFAIMTKVGVYAMLRVYTLIFGAEPIATWLLSAAVATLLIAAIGVLASRDLRVQIAWLVVLSVGTLMCGIGLFNVTGIGAALFYLVHTTLITGGLFLLADLVGARREQTRLEPGGRPPHPAWSGVLFLIGAAAAAGIPPSSGFIGKTGVLQAAIGTPALPWIWSGLLAGSMAAVLATSRAGSILFWKSDDAPAVPAPPRWLWTPAALLLSAALWLAALGGPLLDYTTATAAQLLAPGNYVAAVLGQVTKP